eukprot:TRINITY_DN3141_c7_g1_i1.p1 TRINITY_DN3141_c7_g1~~TRINITY_DN3141_c7_g1_i1.p1  ORF type:complete len:431 (+),score=82.06 TRINITY_DN3141_c7_g1_i1:46-1293(+)
MEEYHDFVFKGTIIALNIENARRTRMAIESICKAVIDTYKICIAAGPTASDTERMQQCVALPGLMVNHIGWLCQFVEYELTHCLSLGDLEDPMRFLFQRIKVHSDRLVEELYPLVVSEFEHFTDVFDEIYGFLEDVNEFFKLRHRVEVNRVVGIGKNAFFELNNSAGDVYTEVVEQQIANVRDTISDYVENIVGLVGSQNTDETLPRRTNQAVDLLESILPEYLRSVRMRILHPDDDEARESSSEFFGRVQNILEELTKILKSVSVNYSSDFGSIKYKPRNSNVENLETAVNGLIDSLSRLQKLKGEEKSNQLKMELAPHLKNVTDSLQEAGAEPDDQTSFINAVKQGVNSPKSFFEARDTLTEMIDRIDEKETIKARPRSAAVTTPPTDLLIAAKKMCLAMKNINSTVEKTPTL